MVLEDSDGDDESFHPIDEACFVVEIPRVVPDVPVVQLLSTTQLGISALCKCFVRRP